MRSAASGNRHSQAQLGNEIDNSNTGISAGAADIILRNAAGGNTTNYAPGSGVNFAPIQSLSTMTNPAANIAF